MVDSINYQFIGAVSFEKRSLVALQKFLKDGGSPDKVHMVKLAEDSPQLQENLTELKDMGFTQIAKHDRLSSRSLWDWVWSALQNAEGDVVIDATCLPREPLGMILFALSVKRNQLGQIKVLYVSAPPNGYATLNDSLPPEDQWLSKGVVTIRSILGFPGNFGSEKKRHVVAMAGHEHERLFDTIIFHEPNRLSISNEQESTSTVEGAERHSKEVADKLRREIAPPEIETVKFSANSIDGTFDSLKAMGIDSDNENVALVAMNTKLSFIGAALFALQDRNIRMVYAVPEKYNPLYCTGVGELKEYDITEYIKSSKTTQVRSNPE